MKDRQGVDHVDLKDKILTWIAKSTVVMADEVEKDE